MNNQFFFLFHYMKLTHVSSTPSIVCFKLALTDGADPKHKIKHAMELLALIFLQSFLFFCSIRRVTDNSGVQRKRRRKLPCNCYRCVRLDQMLLWIKSDAHFVTCRILFVLDNFRWLKMYHFVAKIR